MKKGLIALVISGVLGVALLFAGTDGLETMGDMIHTHIQEAFDRLKVTDAQREQIMAMLESRHEQIKKEVTGLVQAREDLFLQIHSETFNEAGVREASRKVAAIEEELAVLRARIASDIHAQLTPEQLKEAKEMVKEFKSKMQAHMGAGHCGMGGFMNHGDPGGGFLKKMIEHLHGDGHDTDGHCDK